MSSSPQLLRAPFLAVYLLAMQGAFAAQLRPATVQTWDEYIRLTEKRVAAELSASPKFLATDFLSIGEARPARALLKSGKVFIRRLETRDENRREVPVDRGMIHHWVGVIFVPHMTLDFLIRWVQDYDHHARYFNEVEKSKLISRDGNTFKIYLRLRRKKVVTVIYNSDHTAIYRTHDRHHVSSRSFATRIAEVDDPGSPAEKEKPVGNDRGFLWRLNSYWRFVEQDGGVMVECESVSLSRSIPAGLGWMIRDFVESIPRESLENTLTAIRDGSQQARGPEIEAR
ncbi:MAG: hypothetical protein HYX72_10005 [Acidobacteria bacterium]|nr:hypothetical protein [Acidobacteriota bacterium]